ncbi:MAG TPA: GNAT family N-acetyltransferase [Candidatus Binataceae bacterium]|nr:GNAT family N-acetyltransferase [Candidatus Binataceae bacterium]
MRHPEHDRLCDEIRSWYRTPSEAIGYAIERRRFGLYRHNTANPDSARLIVDGATPGDVSAMLSDAADYFGNREVKIWIDDHGADARLGPALLAAGCARENATIFLAHTGPLPHVSDRADVSIAAVTPATLGEYVIVKLKGFAHSEDEPAVERIIAETAVRAAELRGPGRFFIARTGGEAAAILAYYGGADRLIFNLATRVPMRNRGLARLLLCGAIDRGCRSTIINTDPDDTPINWYRRLGFDDEIYWLRNYSYRRSN